MGPSYLPPQPYGRTSYNTCDDEVAQKLISPTGKPANNEHLVKVMVLWPLVLHVVVSIGIAALMMHYVDGNHFNTQERSPQVVLADGTTTPWGRYAPLQSDITTFISVSLAALRLITAAWLGPLCWRCAFILLEKTGLRPQQLYGMIGYGVPVLPGKSGKPISWLIWVILVIVLPVHIIAPVLSGSVTWVPHNQPMNQPSQSSIPVPAVTSNSTQWFEWNYYLPRRERAYIQAAGLASMAWGREYQDDDLKRVLASAAGLAVNSTISNVTLPYFSVTKIEWVEDLQTLTDDQRSIRQVACLKIPIYNQTECPLVRELGTVALIPDSPAWADNRSFPSPSIVSETRLMVLYTHWIEHADDPTVTCQPMFDGFPSNIAIHRTGDTCWAFTWVTYTAGVSDCNRCRVSSYATVQSDEKPTAKEDLMTGEALLMMPSVIGLMVLMGTSIPSPQNGLDEYVTSLLRRAYAVSWASITSQIGRLNPELYTTYSAALLSTRALVDSKRVYIWLGIQLLLTASGLLYIWVQIGTGNPMVSDTTLAAFYLDSSDVYEVGQYDRLNSKDGALLGIEYEDGHLKLKVD